LILTIFILTEKKSQNDTDQKEEKQIKEIENVLFATLSESLSVVGNVCSITKKVASPNIGNIQFHVGISSNGIKVQDDLFKNGYVNSHLCLNAETREFHTECDSSYTIISVPSQLSRSNEKGEFNKGHFEMKINEKKILVIPMSVGTTFTYSGFMLSHRQQIYRGNNSVRPFVNIVSYNSKRLFNNMMESFRRYLCEDNMEHQPDEK